MSSPAYEPLSAQDASFVFFEQRATHMHVAALAILEVGPLRSPTGSVDATRLRRYGESQIARLPRYRQKLADVPPRPAEMARVVRFNLGDADEPRPTPAPA